MDNPVTSTSQIFLVYLVLVMNTFSSKTYSQDKYVLQTINLSVKGTSTLHDWEIKTDKGALKAIIDMKEDKISFTKLRFSIPVASLKSGNGKMDKNTYKALNVTNYPEILFQLTSAHVSNIATDAYQINGTGNLSIAGTTKTINISATCKYNKIDKSYSCAGSKQFKMSDYNVKSPTVMLGTIKTGDDVTITFILQIKR